MIFTQGYADPSIKQYLDFHDTPVSKLLGLTVNHFFADSSILVIDKPFPT